MFNLSLFGTNRAGAASFPGWPGSLFAMNGDRHGVFMRPSFDCEAVKIYKAEQVLLDTLIWRA